VTFVDESDIDRNKYSARVRPDLSMVELGTGENGEEMY
jgi:hypothetical protein